MHYTTLGRTGLKVGVTGLGCGGNSRIGLGTDLSQAQSADLVRAALDLGVKFIDTAEAYGTEHIAGQATAGRPREPRHHNGASRPPFDGLRAGVCLVARAGTRDSASRARQQDCPIGAGMPPSLTQALTRGREPACAS
ncbi:MAG: hypothetical protein F9K29_19275 [Hyphomicrobiaceae bacterium]|nr:MAG: hypothetical protein F9K29_19275 [Hyphomicrobiaceae bacterium]